MTELARITRTSGRLYWAAVGLGYSLPMVVIISVLHGYLDPAALVARFPALVEGTEVTALQGTFAATIAVIAVFPMVAACRAMSSLFNRYRRGEILSDASAHDILRIGRAMLYVALATVLVPMLQLLVISWNGPGRMLQIGIDGGTLGFLLSAGLLTVIGWVMREAARVKVENEGFV